MSRSKIEWCDWTENPVKGLCPMACSYCYGRRLYQRFHWNPEIRYDPWAMMKLPTKPSRIFVGSTMELFGPWVKPGYIEEIQRRCGLWSKHTFIFLTKKPENLPREWPDNCWVGVSVTGDEAMKDAYEGLDCTLAKVKFLSFEPLLGPLSKANLELISAGCHYRWLDWAIIGQCTPVRKSTTPKLEWVSAIVQAADRAGTPVFLKDSLRPLLTDHPEFWDDVPQGDHPNYESVAELRQEFPQGKDHAQ